MTEQTPAPASDNAAPAPAPATSGEHMIPKTRLDEEIGKRRGLEEQLSHMAQTILDGVPEKLKPLIPEKLSPAEQAAWYQRAKETGVFDKTPDPANDDGKGQEKTVPQTDTGKPKVTPTDQDLSTLPPHARMAKAYG